MTVLMCGIAFLAGVLGTFIGGTQVFIMYGALGLVQFAMHMMGMDTTFFDTYIMNCVFLPCVIFGGFGFAMAYASKNHNVAPSETTRTLSRFHDPKVYLVAGISGIAGYLLNVVFGLLQLPIDTGALTVLALGFSGRILFNRSQKYNHYNLVHLKDEGVYFWAKNFAAALIASLVTCMLVQMTGVTAIGFSISAVSLLFCFKFPNFIATHHASMIAGYAIAMSGNIVFACACGLAAHLIFILFGKIFNDNCGTFIDPPAVAIASMSLLLFGL